MVGTSNLGSWNGHWSQGLACVKLPSGYVKIAIENGPVIVDLPIKDGDFP
jgi:hypothetical protein